MNFVRIMLAISILILIGLACAFIAGLVPQTEIVDIALKIAAILGLITAGGVVISKLTQAK